MAKASKKRGKKKAAKRAKKSKARKSVKRAPARRKGTKRAPAKRTPEPWPMIFAVLLAVTVALVAAYFNASAHAAVTGSLTVPGADMVLAATYAAKNCGFDMVVAALPSLDTIPN